MNYPYYDNFTILLYLFVGSLCMFSVNLARGSFKRSHYSSIVGFSFLFIILILFASLRKVGLHLGGEDALNYQNMFINFFNNEAERFQSTDIMFGFFTESIRRLTDNPIIYRLVCYGIIAVSYVNYIRYFCPQGVSCVPFICILIPFMRSFNTMRNSLSIALFLLCIVAFAEKKVLKCIVFLTLSLLMHRLTAIMLAFFPFYWIFKRYLIRAKRAKILIFTVVMLGVSYLIAVQLQSFILAFSLFDNNGNSDMWYLTNNQGSNIILSWPMYIMHVLLFILFLLTDHLMRPTKKYNTLKIIFLFDFIMMPASLVLGMWRFAEYFYISNLILWGIYIKILSKRFTPTSSSIISCGFALAFYALLYFRLIREWHDASLMPYLFIWQ